MSAQLLTHFICPAMWFVIIITVNTHHWSRHRQAFCCMSVQIIVRFAWLFLDIACCIKLLLYPPRRKTVNWREFSWTTHQLKILDNSQYLYFPLSSHPTTCTHFALFSQVLLAHSSLEFDSLPLTHRMCCLLPLFAWSSRNLL
jgi:hypothetical protein